MSESVAGSVLVIADDGPGATAVVDAMRAATVLVEWAPTLAALRMRVMSGDRAPALVVVDLELADTCKDALLTLVIESFPLATVVALSSELSGDRGARLLGRGISSLVKPVCPAALAALALRFSLGDDAKQRSPMLESVFSKYSIDRVLSKQQQMILRMYLRGMNDKEIAQAVQCSEATVYEHWRRMARKAGGSQKGDAIADFHRFLAQDGS